MLVSDLTPNSLSLKRLPQSGAVSRGNRVSQEETDLSVIREELTSIRIALSLIAINQVDAADSSERERHQEASVKALDLLLRRIEDR